MPILKLTVLTFSYKLVASVSEVIADSKIVKLYYIKCMKKKIKN